MRSWGKHEKRMKRQQFDFAHPINGKTPWIMTLMSSSLNDDVSDKDEVDQTPMNLSRLNNVWGWVKRWSTLSNCTCAAQSEFTSCLTAIWKVVSITYFYIFNNRLNKYMWRGTGKYQKGAFHNGKEV